VQSACAVTSSLVSVPWACCTCTASGAPGFICKTTQFQEKKKKGTFAEREFGDQVGLLQRGRLHVRFRASAGESSSGLFSRRVPVVQL
ncbi:hypothetical protein BaRGS_00035322, partial [Batillaria attramentaria]